MISKFLLIHSAYAYSKIGMSADRKPTWGNPVSLSNVWIDFNSVQTDGSTGKQPANNGTFYFDLTNSKPENFTPVMGMKIIWNEKEMTINSIKLCECLDGSKHYQCGVN